MLQRPDLCADDPRADAQSRNPEAACRKRLATLCAWCRRFQAPDGTWQPGRRATDATVRSHGICPDCAQRPDLAPF
jgi:hypothetical protein